MTMPTYEYLCENCGYEFERFQAITAKPARKCPHCGEASLKRLIGTGSGVIFKGSGFYQTDYRSESYKKGEKSEKGATVTDTGKKETKETKSDKKSKPGKKSEKKSA
jgi:putative FmdB family regulatory protein